MGRTVNGEDCHWFRTVMGEDVTIGVGLSRG